MEADDWLQWLLMGAVVWRKRSDKSAETTGMYV